MDTILLIFMLQLVFMPLLVLRTNFMVRSKCGIAAAFGFVEATVYILGLSMVLTKNNGFPTMLVYASGFAIGICLGGFFEKKLAIGNIIVTVNIKKMNQDLINHLRNSNFHFTVFEGQGIDGSRYRFDILISRHRECELIKLIEAFEPEAFIVVLEPRKHKIRKNLKLK
jgi:uncharacterized protein YebE (UPF0316 family)